MTLRLNRALAKDQSESAIVRAMTPLGVYKISLTCSFLVPLVLRYCGIVLKPLAKMGAMTLIGVSLNKVW